MITGSSQVIGVLQCLEKVNGLDCLSLPTQEHDGGVLSPILLEDP